MVLTDSCSCRSTVLVGLWYVVLHHNAHKKPCIGSTSWNCYTPFALSNRLWRQSKTSWADMPRYIASWGGNTWNDLEIKLGSNNIYRGFRAFSKCIRDIGIQYCISSKKYCNCTYEIFSKPKNHPWLICGKEPHWLWKGLTSHLAAKTASWKGFAKKTLLWELPPGCKLQGPSD